METPPVSEQPQNQDYPKYRAIINSIAMMLICWVKWWQRVWALRCYRVLTICCVKVGCAYCLNGKWIPCLCILCIIRIVARCQPYAVWSIFYLTSFSKTLSNVANMPIWFSLWLILCALVAPARR